MRFLVMDESETSASLCAMAGTLVARPIYVEDVLNVFGKPFDHFLLLLADVDHHIQLVNDVSNLSLQFTFGVNIQ